MAVNFFHLEVPSEVCRTSPALRRSAVNVEYIIMMTVMLSRGISKTAMLDVLCPSNPGNVADSYLI